MCDFKSLSLTWDHVSKAVMANGGPSVSKNAKLKSKLGSYVIQASGLLFELSGNKIIPDVQDFISMRLYLYNSHGDVSEAGCLRFVMNKDMIAATIQFLDNLVTRLSAPAVADFQDSFAFSAMANGRARKDLPRSYLGVDVLSDGLDLYVRYDNAHPSYSYGIIQLKNSQGYGSAKTDICFQVDVAFYQQWSTWLKELLVAWDSVS